MPTVALLYGTRPQVIKASVLRRELARQATVLAVDTGQHYDYELNGLLYRQLDVRDPDLFLEVGSGSHAVQTAAVMARAEEVLSARRPEAVVVIGDTNSTLGAALAAAKLRIPVAHVEAGLRSVDAYLAEEINRRAVDAIAGLLCTPSSMATGRVRRERPDPGARVVQTGDVARDVLAGCEPRLPAPEAVTGLARPPYAFATLHRAELTDEPAILLGVLEALGALPLPVILALHPRTRAVLERAGSFQERIGTAALVPPVGYLESLGLVRGAAVVITDSGGVQREAFWLGTPCVTVRAESEWTETLDLGANRLADPFRPGDIAGAVAAQRDRWRDGPAWDRDVYGAGDAAARVAAAAAEWLEAR